MQRSFLFVLILACLSFFSFADVVSNQRLRPISVEMSEESSDNSITIGEYSSENADSSELSEIIEASHEKVMDFVKKSFKWE